MRKDSQTGIFVKVPAGGYLDPVACPYILSGRLRQGPILLDLSMIGLIGRGSSVIMPVRFFCSNPDSTDRD